MLELIWFVVYCLTFAFYFILKRRLLPLAYLVFLADLSPSRRRRLRLADDERERGLEGSTSRFAFRSRCFPFWSFASAPSGGAWWSSTSFLVWSPWCGIEEKSGSVGSSINNPGDQPDLEVSFLLHRISPCRRGGGRGGVEELRAHLRCPDKATRSWSISPVVAVARR